MSKLTACRECKWVIRPPWYEWIFFRNDPLFWGCRKAPNPMAGKQQYRNKLTGKEIIFWDNFEFLPLVLTTLNDDGHCPHFQQKENGNEQAPKEQ